MGKRLICDRCGADVTDRFGTGKSRLYPHEFTDDVGDKVKMELCWDCDWDVMNGREPFEDSTDIYYRRWEEMYSYDPVNTPPPPGYQ